jgi:pyridoxine 5-phosphate synthase
MPRLGVNIDHFATLRQVRSGREPEPVYAALICQEAGADSIVAHLREDRRHIQERDLRLLKETVAVRLNFEISLDPGVVAIAARIRPDQVTFVPEKRREVTTEGGLNLLTHALRLRQAMRRCASRGIEVSLFIDPDRRQIDAARSIGAGIVEFHTGRYAQAWNSERESSALEQLSDAVAYATAAGMRVCAGHGLDYANVRPIAGIRGIEELNIGYSIVCRAAIAGLRRAVTDMLVLTGGAIR